jgi:phosphatidylinositol alpha-1,6-mannosyltransferase
MFVLKTLWVTAQFGSFDLIFCGHINLSPVAAFLGSLLHIPVWLQAHGIDSWECPPLWRCVAVKRAALVTAVSRYTRRRLLQWSGIDSTRVRVLPNTVRSFFSPGPPCESVLAKLGLQRKKVILTVSRITREDYYKGHERIIRALPALLSDHPQLVYAIVGDGSGKADLEELVSRLELQSYVRFLGRISDEDVLALYRSSTVFIMPSIKEGFGIVFVEAAAVGMHVIGGNADGSADALADGRIGRMIDPVSQREIRGALTDALEGGCRPNPKEAQRFRFENFATYVDELARSFAHEGG